MARHDHVVEREQRVVARRRLRLEDVEAGAAKLAVAERLDQCGLIDEPARGRC